MNVGKAIVNHPQIDGHGMNMHEPSKIWAVYYSHPFKNHNPTSTPRTTINSYLFIYLFIDLLIDLLIYLFIDMFKKMCSYSSLLYPWLSATFTTDLVRELLASNMAARRSCASRRFSGSLPTTKSSRCPWRNSSWSRSVASCPVNFSRTLKAKTLTETTKVVDCR